MPTNTAGKWPYPLPTEPTRDGAINMQALADTADRRLANCGVQYGAVGGGVADANGALSVTFAKPFLTVPAVTVTVRDSAILAILYGPQQTASYFTVLFKTLAGAVRPGAIEFSWIAYGPVA
jgi:hypothetical protein